MHALLYRRPTLQIFADVAANTTNKSRPDAMKFFYLLENHSSRCRRWSLCSVWLYMCNPYLFAFVLAWSSAFQRSVFLFWASFVCERELRWYLYLQRWQCHVNTTQSYPIGARNTYIEHKSGAYECVLMKSWKHHWGQKKWPKASVVTL